MSIKVNFEIGHEASIRTKRTPEGFTHDWEVFVRGVDNADISQFVDRVIFQLHETFPKPKRVVKEPPYTVKESGYAGFNLPIEIYLKNRDEPKKVRFTYDLHLQPAGPAIVKVQKEKYVFSNPSDDFRKKLLKGGGMIVNNTNPFLMHTNMEHERNSRDSFTDEKPSQLIGKPKLSGDNAKKHKSKEHRSEDVPRPSNSFENLFGPPIHKISRISPDPKKPSPNPKGDKKDKEKIQVMEKEKIKSKHENREYRDEKMKSSKDEKERLKEEKRMKSHKDLLKDKGLKRVADRPISPQIPPKRLLQQPASPVSPIRSNGNTLKDDHVKKSADLMADSMKNKSLPKQQDMSPSKDKKKKDKKAHDKDREAKKEHKKEKESKNNILEMKDPKQREMPKEIVNKETSLSKDRDKKPEKPFNKFSIENMLKDPEPTQKRKDKGDKERKHKHKKKDKKRDTSRERGKETNEKEKKHRHEKHSHKENEKNENVHQKEEKNSLMKSFKEKERIQMTASPISIDTSSQSSSKSVPKIPMKTKVPESRIESLNSDSDSQSEVSIVSEDEAVSINSESNNSRGSKKFEDKKVENDYKDKAHSSGLKPGKSKDNKIPKLDKEEKRAKKRKSNKSEDPKLDDEKKRTSDESKFKSDSSPRSKSDTKVQDDGVSSSLSDHPLDSTCGDDIPIAPERKPISPDYMIQLKELQRRIMTIQSNDELEKVVHLIAETGKYEVTKKTFDFDLCLLDRSTVQQLQELIGCESRA